MMQDGRGESIVDLQDAIGDLDEESRSRIRAPGPGDFAVVDTRTRTSVLVRLAKALSGGGFTMFDHAVICSRVGRDGTVYIVEAMPGGVRENVWHYDNHDHLWSTGVVKTSAKAGRAALAYVDAPCTSLDYAALSAHALHLRLPRLRQYVGSPKHLISSQLVDRAQLDAGVQLFADGRWPGFVRPSDLAELILKIGELTMGQRARAVRR